MQAAIVTEGLHNADLTAAAKRLECAGTYRDLSTVIICPTRGLIPDRVVQAWMGLIRPMNQKVVGPIFIRGMEVGDAYCQALDLIFGNPELATYKYLLTIEEDNLPPADGLMKLYESIEGQVDGRKYDAVGGLYWTKGEGGQPMIYGDPKQMPKHFMPQVPIADAVQEANGLGMGFTLFRMEIFRNERLPRPIFKTCQEIIPGIGAKLMTQDLYFYENAGRLGYRFASDNRVKVGHYDAATDIVW